MLSDNKVELTKKQVSIKDDNAQLDQTIAQLEQAIATKNSELSKKQAEHTILSTENRRLTGQYTTLIDQTEQKQSQVNEQEQLLAQLGKKIKILTDTISTKKKEQAATALALQNIKITSSQRQLRLMK